MTQIFGDFTQDFSGRSEFLVLGFSPTSLPIQLRWKTNGLSADFLGDYVRNFFPGDTSEDITKQSEVRGAVSFIANELLENAMKYSDEHAGQLVNLEVHLFSDRLVFLSKNSVRQDAIDGFKSYLKELTTSDISEMYINQVEKSAASGDDDSGSGLGYLTMMMDYEAILGWQFGQSQNNSQVTIVTTMVQLPL